MALRAVVTEEVGGGGGHGGGGTGGGGHAGGTTTGGAGSYRGATNANALYKACNQPRQIVSPFRPSASDNQQVIYELANGTGGFVILNTNNLLGGLQPIAQDENPYYWLADLPAVSAEGGCHSLKVKVERGGTEVRARSGYCNVRPTDLLAGNPIEKDLESRAGGEMKGNVTASMEAPFLLHLTQHRANSSGCRYSFLGPEIREGEGQATCVAQYSGYRLQAR